MNHLTAAQARRFAEEWLPAWTGNDPERLASFYSEDALYLDPGVPDGVRGKPALLTYFRKLLAKNPGWVWSQIEGIPLEDGFLNKWLARIPVGAATLEVVGVCLVQLDRAGKIRRNEVYFDRAALHPRTRVPEASVRIRPTPLSCDPPAAAPAGDPAPARVHEPVAALFEHMFWADRRILSLLNASAGSPGEGVVRLFSHLLAAERVWRLRLRGEDASLQPIWPDLSLEEVNAMAAANLTGYRRYLRGLSERDLQTEVEYTNSRGTPFRTRVADILLHVALHGSYHRGQIASALRSGGAEPVNTDYITFVREHG